MSAPNVSAVAFISNQIEKFYVGILCKTDKKVTDQVLKGPKGKSIKLMENFENIFKAEKNYIFSIYSKQYIYLFVYNIKFYLYSKIA